MVQLQQQMVSLQRQQADLLQQLRLRQQMELHVLLRRLAEEDRTPAQMAVDWRDLAALPGLAPNERKTATGMKRRAAADAANVARWRKHLQKLASQLRMPAATVVIPKPKNAFLSWLADQFRLRRVPQGEQRALMRLRARILEVDYGLAVGVWPKPQEWRRLLRDLQRHFGSDADLGLPVRIEDVRKDMAVMHEAAAAWLQRL